jgi:hypothetical protein
MNCLYVCRYTFSRHDLAHFCLFMEQRLAGVTRKEIREWARFHELEGTDDDEWANAGTDDRR